MANTITIYDRYEAENSVSSILEHTAEDGKAYQTTFYNLDAIITKQLYTTEDH